MEMPKRQHCIGNTVITVHGSQVAHTFDEQSAWLAHEAQSGALWIEEFVDLAKCILLEGSVEDRSED